MLWLNSECVDDTLFWEIQLLIHMGVFSEDEIRALGEAGVGITLIVSTPHHNQSCYDPGMNMVCWDRGMSNSASFDSPYNWHRGLPLDILAHELDHAYTHNFLASEWDPTIVDWSPFTEKKAVRRQNRAREIWFRHSPEYKYLYPRLFFYPWPLDLPGDPDVWWSIWNNVQPFFYYGKRI